VRGGQEAIDAADQGDAYRKIERLADEPRRQNPGLKLTKEAVSAKIFTAPEHADLARRAHRRPGPTTSFGFPR
jgi:hypothetical protein